MHLASERHVNAMSSWVSLPEAFCLIGPGNSSSVSIHCFGCLPFMHATAALALVDSPNILGEDFDPERRVGLSVCRMERCIDVGDRYTVFMVSLHIFSKTGNSESARAYQLPPPPFRHIQQGPSNSRAHPLHARTHTHRTAHSSR